jgi:hypothetical protein
MKSYLLSTVLILFIFGIQAQSTVPLLPFNRNINLTSLEPLYFKIDLTNTNIKTEQVVLIHDTKPFILGARIFVAHESLTNRPNETHHHYRTYRWGGTDVLPFTNMTNFTTPIYYMKVVSFERNKPFQINILLQVISKRITTSEDGKVFKGKMKKDSRFPVLVFDYKDYSPGGYGNRFISLYMDAVVKTSSETNETIGYLSYGKDSYPNKVTTATVALKNSIKVRMYEHGSSLFYGVAGLSVIVDLDFEISMHVNYVRLSSRFNLFGDYFRNQREYQYYTRIIKEGEDETIIISPVHFGVKLNTFYVNYETSPEPSFPTKENYKFISNTIARNGEYWGNILYLPASANRMYASISLREKKGEKFFITNQGGEEFQNRLHFNQKFVVLIRQEKIVNFNFEGLRNGFYTASVQLLNDEEVILEQYNHFRGSGGGRYVELAKGKKDFNVKLQILLNEGTVELTPLLRFRGNNVINIIIN